MEVNLISDTVTRPTKEMLDYMMQAPVGDDVFKEDPTINALENKVAQLFGKEAEIQPLRTPKIPDGSPIGMTLECY